MNKNIGSVETTANKAGKGLASMGGILGGAVVTGVAATTAAVGSLVIGLAAVGTAGVSAAADLEQQIANIRSVMSGTIPSAEALQDAILALSIDPGLKVNATQAAQAIELLSRNGLAWQDIANGAAQSSIVLANATGADFGQAADIATDVMALFNIQAGEMGTAVDGITSVITNSKFSINDYALALAQGGGVAASVGVSFEDFNTTIAAISPLFASGSDAGTSFKIFLQRLIPQSNAAKEEMAALGLYTAETGSAFFDAQGNMKSMVEISALLNQATAGLSEAQLNQAFSTIFGTDAMRAAFGVAQAGDGTFQQLQATMADTSAADAVAMRMDTLKGTMEILQGVFEATSIQIGNALMPSVRLLADGLLNFVSANQGVLIPFFEQINEYLMTLIPAAINTASTFWTSTLQPALAATSEYISTTLIPTISKIGEFLSTVLPPAIELAATILSDVFQTALAVSGSYIETIFLPKINMIVDILTTALPMAIQIASALWSNTLQPALATVTNFLINTVFPTYAQLVSILSELLPVAITTVSTLWTSTLQPALLAIGEFINSTVIPAFNLYSGAGGGAGVY